MRIAELAKDYLGQVLHEGALHALMGKDESVMGKDDFILHTCALRLMTSSMKPFFKKGPSASSFEEISAEIDRRTAIITDWTPKGGRFIKEFTTADEVLDAWRVLKECVPVEAKNAPTDNSRNLTISAREHQVLMLLMEGRMNELY